MMTKAQRRKQLKTFESRIVSLKSGDRCPLCGRDWAECKHGRGDLESRLFELRVLAIINGGR